MTDNILFDNFLITDDEKVAEKFAKDSWKVKTELEVQAKKDAESKAKEATPPPSGGAADDEEEDKDEKDEL
jgi:16S rRNA U516 pseudouridylate synthase RsuA-like enzyme